MKKTIALLTALAACNNVYADSLLGIYIGINSWEQNYDGFIRDLDATDPLLSEVDLTNDLGISDERGNVMYAALEHGVPVLPNFKVQHTELEVNASNQLTRTIEYGGQTFTANTDVNSQADLTHTDLTLYYQVLDNWVSLDLGLTARAFDGFVSIDESLGTQMAEEEFKAVVPLIYIAARFDLPLTGLYAGGHINGLGDGDNSFIDYQLMLGYETDIGFGIEAGFRSLELTLDDIDDIEADITVDGAYGSLFYHF